MNFRHQLLLGIVVIAVIFVFFLFLGKQNVENTNPNNDLLHSGLTSEKQNLSKDKSIPTFENKIDRYKNERKKPLNSLNNISFDFSKKILKDGSFFKVFDLKGSDDKKGIEISLSDYTFSYDEFLLQKGDVITHFEEVSVNKLTDNIDENIDEWLSYDTMLLTIIRNEEVMHIEVEVN